MHNERPDSDVRVQENSNHHCGSSSLKLYHKSSAIQPSIPADVDIMLKGLFMVQG